MAAMLLKVAKIKKEAAEVFSIIFAKPKNFHFYPGQHLEYELVVNDPNDNSRAFTISSSPSEEFLMLSTKEGITAFKKALTLLKKGEQIKTSHPIGTFSLDETTPAVLIAGGIGITPFRSMIKYAVDHKLATPMTLIYSNPDEDFPFKKELDVWQKELPSLTIYYINTVKEGRLDKEKLSSLTTNYPLQREASQLLTTNFYLAGPPKMVDDLAKILKEMGVDETNIRSDRFDGYI